MKLKLKRFISFTTAVLMLFNMLPTEVLAADNNPSAVYENGLMVQLPEGALTPQQVLGGALEFGVVAGEYTQTAHTETNFAVKVFDQDIQQCVEIMGSGDTPIPFYVGKLPNGKRVWMGENTKVDSDVFINEKQKATGSHNGKNMPPYVQYSSTAHKTNVYGRPESEINGYVDSLLNYVNSVSNLMKNKTTITPSLQAGGVLDLTGDGFPESGTIYINCDNLKGFLGNTGWKIKKREGQTVVFNIGNFSDFKIAKIDLTVLKKNGRFYS